MDNNVSKNTNSHNFFKLEIEPKKLGISARNFLKLQLLTILNSDRLKFNVQIEQKTITSILENKISISNHKNQSSKQKCGATRLVETEFMPIIYSCPIGLLFETELQQTPQIIMQQIEQLVSSNQEKIDFELSSSLSIEIVDRGWINFYLDSKFMAIWLQKSFIWHHTEKIDARQFAKQQICGLENTPPHLFPVQYIHARCCSLLNLGAKEYSSSLSIGSEWIIRLILTQKCVWLNERNWLWLAESAERNLLQQLLIVADSWIGNTSHQQWSKLGLSLTQATDIFLADCRFLGEAKEKYPQLAIARLGLIALVKLWLRKILVEKFGVVAPYSL